jgi:hypothetical protein
METEDSRLGRARGRVDLAGALVQRIRDEAGPEVDLHVARSTTSVATSTPFGWRSAGRLSSTTAGAVPQELGYDRASIDELHREGAIA